jgi:large repetitive protein
MSQLIGPAFGTGKDGSYTVSSPTTDAPIDSSCSGTAGAVSLTATNTSFSAGQRIMIHQSRGTGAGQWEENTILSYTAGTITTANPLTYTYTDSGASQAQVLVIEQHGGITISDTLTAKAWDGDVGGIVALCSNGTITISGNVNANGKGYRGGQGTQGGYSYQGEGEPGAGAALRVPNGSGGGGSLLYGAGGTGGITYMTDVTCASRFVFGGGGGGGAGVAAVCPYGGAGGGIVFLLGKKIIISGTVTSTGANGDKASDNSSASGAGGGGMVLIKSELPTIGTNLISCVGGTRPTSQQNADGSAGAGNATISAGDGSEGRIRVEGCRISGTTANPVASKNTGGYSYCGSLAYLL